MEIINAIEFGYHFETLVGLALSFSRPQLRRNSALLRLSGKAVGRSSTDCSGTVRPIDIRVRESRSKDRGADPISGSSIAMHQALARKAGFIPTTGLRR
jgi:hypothetical protein